MACFRYRASSSRSDTYYDESYDPRDGYDYPQATDGSQKTPGLKPMMNYGTQPGFYNQWSQNMMSYDGYTYPYDHSSQLAPWVIVSFTIHYILHNIYNYLLLLLYKYILVVYVYML